MKYITFESNKISTEIKNQIRPEMCQDILGSWFGRLDVIRILIFSTPMYCFIEIPFKILVFKNPDIQKLILK